MNNNIKIISGNSNKNLAIKICNNLELDLSNSLITTFSDGEIRIELGSGARGKDVYVIQSVSPPNINNNFMELISILDSLKRADCFKITAVIPYLGYSRQDKKIQPGVPISAKMIADILQIVGVDRLVTIDLHSSQIQGFYNCPVDNLYASNIFLGYIRSEICPKNEEIVVIAPDAGSFGRVTAYAKRINASMAIIYKRRNKPNEIGQMELLGDVKNKTAIIIDDMIDTAGTICTAGEKIKNEGANKIIVYATHGVFSGPALKRISESAFDKIYVTDSIKPREEVLNHPKIEILGCEYLLSETIKAIHNRESVSKLFKHD